MSVLEKVVEKKWCVGCGMCVAVCPKSRLMMFWNEHAEYNPAVRSDAPDCSSRCSVCFDVCPAHGQTKNESEIGRELYGKILSIHHTPETGYWLSSYVGYSKDHRFSSASGGIATWVLEFLLKNGEVDMVIAVGRTSNPDKLFEFRVCKSVEQIRKCSRSAYYPVEVSQVVRHILENRGRYAVIGLPCVCKAIRLAQKKLPKLKQRIVKVLGLTCGHTCSKFFAEYICALGGGDPYYLKEFIFRTKDLSQPASNHGMYFTSGHTNNQFSNHILWLDGVHIAFNNSYFQIPGCFYCDDVFAECADITFMDAWLSEYSKQPEGHTIALVRNNALHCIIKSGVECGELNIEELSIRKTIKSQQGVVDRKRQRFNGTVDVPRKRVNLLKRKNFIQRYKTSLIRSCSSVSSVYWIKSGKNLVKFTNMITPFQKKIDLVSKIYNIFRLPRRVLGKAVRSLGREF